MHDLAWRCTAIFSGRIHSADRPRHARDGAAATETVSLDQDYTCAAARRDNSSRHAGGAAANNKNIAIKPDRRALIYRCRQLNLLD
jgi:hypothetical protein